MLLKIFKNRTVSSSGTWGTKNENNYEILNFEFPAELEEYNKRIVYYLGNQKVWDAIIDNKAILTNAITTKGSVKAYIWCTKSDEAFETDVDFRTQIFVMNFFENDNADGIVPTPEQVDGFNTMLTAMNEKIEEIDELETKIENAETQRQENEETRQNNEATRQENEQTRQTQEADRERRTDEAIGNIEDKTAEYNANAEAKTTAFNNNATQKTNEFNSNYTQKVNDFNSNASSKTSAFNSNAETKTNTFNTNATNKTNDFNSNASSKTTTFNDNAASKTNTFNSNASSKTTDFNTNAESKTNTFNDNATEKTTAFNTNAQNKIDEYDEHIVEYQAQIDELQEEVEELSENMPWNTTEQATYLDITDAAKYSKNKMKVFGNTEQAQYSGKNLFDISLLPITANGITITKDNAGNIVLNGTPNYSSGYKTFTVGTAKNIKAGTYTVSAANKQVGIGVQTNIPGGNLNLTMADTTTARTHTTTDTTSMSSTINIRYDVGTLNNFILNPQFELSSTATDYEPYTGGQPSPNPDYPQDIHVVKGHNVIGFEADLFGMANNLQDRKAFTTGTNIINNDQYCVICLDYLPIITGKQYDMKTQNGIRWLRLNFYDKNKTFLRGIYFDANTNYSFTPKENEAYIRFSMRREDYDTLQILYIVRTLELDLPEGIELCKTENYQDYIYKENGNWYKYGAINKSVLNGTEANWSMSDNIIVCQAISNYSISNNVPFVNYFKGTPNKTNGSTLLNNEACFNNNVGYSRFYIKTDKFENIADFKTWLSTNNLIVYCIARNVATTQITDETLISQLDEIYEHLQLVKGTNNITVTASDLAPNMQLTYMQDLPSKLDNLASRIELLEE